MLLPRPISPSHCVGRYHPSMFRGTKCSAEVFIINSSRHERPTDLCIKIQIRVAIDLSAGSSPGSPGPVCPRQVFRRWAGPRPATLWQHVSQDDQVHSAWERLQEGDRVPVIDVHKAVAVRLWTTDIHPWLPSGRINLTNPSWVSLVLQHLTIQDSLSQSRYFRINTAVPHNTDYGSAPLMNQVVVD